MFESGTTPLVLRPETHAYQRGIAKRETDRIRQHQCQPGGLRSNRTCELSIRIQKDWPMIKLRQLPMANMDVLAFANTLAREAKLESYNGMASGSYVVASVPSDALAMLRFLYFWLGQLSVPRLTSGALLHGDQQMGRMQLVSTALTAVLYTPSIALHLVLVFRLSSPDCPAKSRR